MVSWYILVFHTSIYSIISRIQFLCLFVKVVQILWLLPSQVGFHYICSISGRSFIQKSESHIIMYWPMCCQFSTKYQCQWVNGSQCFKGPQTLLLQGSNRNNSHCWLRNIRALWFFRMEWTIHQRTQHQNAQDLNPQKQCCEDLWSHIFTTY